MLSGKANVFRLSTLNLLSLPIRSPNAIAVVPIVPNHTRVVPLGSKPTPPITLHRKPVLVPSIRLWDRSHFDLRSHRLHVMIVVRVIQRTTRASYRRIVVLRRWRQRIILRCAQQHTQTKPPPQKLQ